MRPTQSTGRPGTPVIPANWTTTHGSVIAKTWTIGVAIRHPGGTKGDFDPVTGTYPTVPHDPHFSGNARIQVLSVEETSHLVADQQVTSAGYRVVVALAAEEVEVDDVVDVVTVPADADQTLVGRGLVVKSVARGSLAWERDLIALDDLG